MPLVKFFVDTYRLDPERFRLLDHERQIEIENWDEVSKFVPEPEAILKSKSEVPLALQLHFLTSSESMSLHDSEVMDDRCIG